MPALWIHAMAYSSLGHNATVICHNAKGLNVPEKCSILLRELKRGKPHFVFLQEIHFNSSRTQAHWLTLLKRTTPQNTFLVSKNASFELTDRLTDPGWTYIFLKGNCCGFPITLVNVYFPNASHLTFCQHMLSELKGSGCVILGDFNIPWTPWPSPPMAKNLYHI